MLTRRLFIAGGILAIPSIFITSQLLSDNDTVEEVWGGNDLVDDSNETVAAALLEGGSESDVAPTGVTGHCPSAVEWEFVNKINSYRSSNGLGGLQMSRSLAAAARHHAYYMSRSDDIDHTLGTVSWSQNIYSYGYPTGYSIGENALAGRQSSGGALSLWITSPTHKANMLDPRWTRIGVGRVYYNPNRYDFYWITTFGSVSHRTISSC
jgi:hypothetical protein